MVLTFFGPPCMCVANLFDFFRLGVLKAGQSVGRILGDVAQTENAHAPTHFAHIQQRRAQALQTANKCRAKNSQAGTC